jgi:ABC-type transport system involved in cytochrome bd biosynthesis fused ATPase/permease subunit
VLYLRAGRLDDHGTHEELLARNPSYAALVNAYEHEHDGDALSGTAAEVATP